MERAFLTKKVLKNFLIIDKPGTSTMTCAATVLKKYGVISTESIYYRVFIRAITKKNLKIVLKLLNDTPIIPFVEVSNYFMSGSIFNNQITDGYALPTKGEKIIVTIVVDSGYYLKVSNINLIPRTSYHRISDEDILPLIQTFKNYYNGNKSNNRPDLS